MIATRSMITMHMVTATAADYKLCHCTCTRNSSDRTVCVRVGETQSSLKGAYLQATFGFCPELTGKKKPKQ